MQDYHPVFARQGEKEAKTPLPTGRQAFLKKGGEMFDSKLEASCLKLAAFYLRLEA